MRRAWAGIAVAALLSAMPARSEDAEEPVPIQRYLESLSLGDYLKEIQLVYPPVREWPSFREPGGVVTRYHVERACAKHFPWEVDVLRLGLRRGRLVHIQAVYTDRFGHDKPLEKLIVELSMRYGEPSRRGMVYSWRDGRTVLRVFNEEMPTPDGKSLEMRPSIEIYERGLRERVD